MSEEDNIPTTNISKARTLKEAAEFSRLLGPNS